jgi:nitroreductase
MDVYEAIRTRKSVRSYLDRPVADDKLRRILEAVRLAPSASNRQEWRFVVVRDAVKKKRIAEEAAGQPFIAEASVVLACCAETDHHRMKCGLECHPIDAAIAIDHLTLAAVAEGLGTCWIGAFDQAVVKEILGIPEEVVVVELLPLGYPRDPSAVEKRRIPLASFVRYDSWS